MDVLITTVDFRAEWRKSNQKQSSSKSHGEVRALAPESNN